MRMTAPSERSGRAGGDAIALLSGRLYRAQQIQNRDQYRDSARGHDLHDAGIMRPYVRPRPAARVSLECLSVWRVPMAEFGRSGAKPDTRGPTSHPQFLSIPLKITRIRARATSPEECGFQTDVAAAALHDQEARTIRRHVVVWMKGMARYIGIFKQPNWRARYEF